MEKHGSVLSGSLLVAGTTIGGGMLALPVLTSLGGFIPSLAVYFACWAFMVATGMLFLELALHLPEGSNIVSMAEKTLGKWGKALAWALYLFLFFCLTLAYIIGCGNLLTDFSQGLVNSSMGPLLFVILFGPFVYAGTRVVGKLNYFLMLGLGVCYLAFTFLGLPHIDFTLLKRREWSLSLLALPIAFTSFAYQGIVPTLVTYMGRDASKVRKSILYGTSLSLIVYIIWQGLILGIVPVEGPEGLKNALAEGKNAVAPLKYYLSNPIIPVLGNGFAFFALLTSFLGVTLGLLDFLADGFRIKASGFKRIILCLLIFVPPLLVAMTWPDLFLVALDYAGGYGCAILLGLLPVMMAWNLRKRYPEHERQLAGGKIVLSLLALFVIIELIIEVTT